ncbi:hypothetical protein GFL38_32705 [Rhizobium leguminosarum bv. viciae]|uniref:hypothetical protein n=1 Tax=Rhizobium ruizarguesonis TaxID=2081791 RepID=UPI00143F8AA9|nr:hypothetical protein [Rhizobium ruizarguesonis]NKJ76934.1 hypothetical protein [Rhizobium leguminosarum bv. viciae]NKQ74943.1 hypothetical protein [Rhizobium ruizarguesonis]NKQ82028.1 hypothetical protein [Rhizobium ruizarguesonis]
MLTSDKLDMPSRMQPSAAVGGPRNLIAHNDCIANEVFSSRTKKATVTLEITSTGRVVIDDEWLRRASYTLDSLVFRFDELASQKFGLHTLNRMSAFLARISACEYHDATRICEGL